jgi:hypothetical protein
MKAELLTGGFRIGIAEERNLLQIPFLVKQHLGRNDDET